MRSFVCVLKTGGDYTEEHVHILRNQVLRSMPMADSFVCLTDLPEIKGIYTLPLIHNLPGKYSMQEVFRIPGRVVVTGLDTLMYGNLDRIWDLPCGEDDFYMIKSFNKRREFANGVMMWNGEWEERLSQNPKGSLGGRLEQEYTIKNLRACDANIKVLNDHFAIESFKWYTKRVGFEVRPEHADFVLFHGTPRPHECETEWVKEVYK